MPKRKSDDNGGESAEDEQKIKEKKDKKKQKKKEKKEKKKEKKKPPKEKASIGGAEKRVRVEDEGEGANSVDTDDARVGGGKRKRTGSEGKGTEKKKSSKKCKKDKLGTVHADGESAEDEQKTKEKKDKKKQKKKEKKKEKKKPKKEKASIGGGEEQAHMEDEGEGANSRLDWSEVRFKGRAGTDQKNKFLRLMGAAKSDQDGGSSTTSVAAGVKAGGLVASLMGKTAPKNSPFGLFSGKGGVCRGGAKADVNAGSRSQQELARQFDQAQSLLKQKHRGGGKMGFSC